jgi:hypothetical protein
MGMRARSGVAALVGWLGCATTVPAGDPGIDVGIGGSLGILNGVSVAVALRSEGALGAVLEGGAQGLLDFSATDGGLLLLAGPRLGTQTDQGRIPAFLQLRAGVLRFPDPPFGYRHGTLPAVIPGAGVDTSWGAMGLRLQVDWPLLFDGGHLAQGPRLTLGAVFRLGPPD